jgi:hypothetical protein
MKITPVPGAIEIRVGNFTFWFGFPIEILFPKLLAWLEGGVKDL